LGNIDRLSVFRENVRAASPTPSEARWRNPFVNGRGHR